MIVFIFLCRFDAKIFQYRADITWLAPHVLINLRQPYLLDEFDEPLFVLDDELHQRCLYQM